MFFRRRIGSAKAIRSVTVVNTMRGSVVALVMAGCSAGTGPNATETQAQSSAGGAAALDTAKTASGGASLVFGADAGAAFTVGAKATVCEQDLTFKVPGCSCKPGTPEQACWTGPLNERHLDHCKDGVQKCEGGGELGQWGPCEGEVRTCHYPPEHVDAGKPDSGSPPPPPCTCEPGVTIGCDEDCQTLVICSLTGYKTCQPDGTWGPCHETSDVTGVVNNVLGCRNWLHGCIPGATDGVFTGDCGKAFTCGYVPGTK